MSRVKEISFSDFNKEVREEKERPVLVKYWAKGCMPCKALGPKIDALALKYPDVKFVSLEIGEQTSASDAGIQALPTLKIYSSGNVVRTFAGTIDTKQLQEVLLKALRG